jgi:hypothetical protein
MKKTILLAVVILLGCTAFAQGNMQFNNAQHLTFSGTSSTAQGTVLNITVPAGKVWKVESGSICWIYQGKASTTGIYLLLDNQILQSPDNNKSTPIWLPAGSYKVEYNTSNGSYSYSGAISVLEFNIIQ